MRPASNVARRRATSAGASRSGVAGRAVAWSWRAGSWSRSCSLEYEVEQDGGQVGGDTMASSAAGSAGAVSSGQWPSRRR